MKYLILLLITLCFHNSWGRNKVVNKKPNFIIREFIATDTIRNNQLSPNESVFHFDLLNLFQEDSNAVVRFSIDEIEYQKPLQSGRLSIKTTPGFHSFQIYVNDQYLESFSPKLSITGQTELVFSVYLRHRRINEPVITYKPVIYLYPEEETEISVSIDIHNGKNPFYYPHYDGRWKGTAKPDGNLIINDKQYRYLFWEAQQADHLNEIEVNEGFVVKGSESISFLEDKLTLFGLTSEEQADFITFWGPIMAKNEQNLVRFEWNENCDKFCDLNISPQPDNLYRIYIFIAPLEGDLTITPQIIPQIDRNGFVAIEWGGQLSNHQPNRAL